MPTPKERLWQIAAILAAVAYIYGLSLVDDRDIYVKVIGLGLVFLALIEGKRLPVPIRLFITAQFFLWTFTVALICRTTAPGLTFRNTYAALVYPAIWGLLPSFCVFRLWDRKRALLFLELLLPVSFLLATAVASTEEFIFLQKYRDTGAGRTPRWTISSNWLAYDRKHHRLYGPWSEPPQYK